MTPVADRRRPRASGRWLVVGALGMLGTEVVRELAGRDATCVDRPDIDIADSTSTRDWVRGHDVVVNCAAWTAVDDAESHEAEAFRVNATGAHNLASAVRHEDAWLVHVSTDYVFRGDSAAPYREDALLDPRSAYGRTKAAGEWAVRSELADSHHVMRTAWLYGENGPNFVRAMAGLEGSRDVVMVVDDQIGQPTWARDLARRVVAAVDGGLPAGTYHATNSGSTSWYGFAMEIFRLLGADPERVRPTSSAEFPRPAPRPHYSVLDQGAWLREGMEPMAEWRDALARALDAGLLAEASHDGP